MVNSGDRRFQFLAQSLAGLSYEWFKLVFFIIMH